VPEVVGIGVDLVHVERFRDVVDRRDRTLLDRWFTAAELAYSFAMADPAAHLAARFAAKEAFLKALGCGLSRDVSLAEIGVVRDDAGKPSLELNGATGRFFAERGAGRTELSLSHDGDYAVAMVVLQR